MKDNMMHTVCLNCGKHAVSVPFGLDGLPYENYSYCNDCIHKAMKLLKHKKMMATWWEQDPPGNNKPRLIGCSRCGRAWCVSPNVPYEEWIAERHFCENCGSYMEEGKQYGKALSILLLVRYRKWRFLYAKRKKAFLNLRQTDKRVRKFLA